MGKPLRIAVVAACPFPWPRGTPVRAHGLAKAVAALGHEVHVVTYHLGKPTPEEGFRVHRTPDVGWYRRVEPGPSYAKLAIMDPLLVRTLRRVLASMDFDLVHAHHYEGLLAAHFATAGRAPIVYDAHTTLGSELPSYALGLPKGIKQRVGRALDRRLPRWADHTIAVTESIASHLVGIDAVDRDEIDVVSNGVDIVPFTNPESEPDMTAPDVPTLVYAGNLARYQRLDLLLDAFRVVLTARADTRLLIVSGDSFDPFEAQARTQGVRQAIDVVHADFSELPSLLSGSDVAVNARIDCAGVPQKNLNYMAAGKPLVSFASSADPYRHGETGLQVEDGDTAGLARAILSLLGDASARARMGAAARATVEERMSWRSQASRVEAVYRAVLSRWVPTAP